MIDLSQQGDIAVLRMAHGKVSALDVECSRRQLFFPHHMAQHGARIDARVEEV